VRTLRKILAILVVFLLLTNVGAISMVHAQTPHAIAMDATITKGIDYLNTLQAVDGHIGESWYVGETGLYILACA
jgi:ABC-type antimicrobial peptide transport system permease subunit